MDDECPDDGRKQYAAQQAAVQVGYYLLKHKCDCCQRCVEGGSQSGGSSGRGSQSPSLLCFAQQTSHDRGHPARELNTRTFPHKAAPTSDTKYARHKFHPHDAKRNHSELLPKGDFKLRNSAAGRLRSEAVEQKAYNARSRYDYCKTPEQKYGGRFVRKRNQSRAIERVHRELKRDGCQAGS
jgi:hypothetical protein